jgi:hypothetical protein
VAALLTSRSYFSHLIAAPFHSGLHEVFTFSAAICLIAAAASWSRGKRFVAEDETRTTRRRDDAPDAMSTNTAGGLDNESPTAAASSALAAAAARNGSVDGTDHSS